MSERTLRIARFVFAHIERARREGVELTEGVVAGGVSKALALDDPWSPPVDLEAPLIASGVDASVAAGRLSRQVKALGEVGRNRELATVQAELGERRDYYLRIVEAAQTTNLDVCQARADAYAALIDLANEAGSELAPWDESIAAAEEWASSRPASARTAFVGLPSSPSQPAERAYWLDSSRADHVRAGLALEPSRDAINYIRIAIIDGLPHAATGDSIGVEMLGRGLVRLWAEHTITTDELRDAVAAARAKDRFPVGVEFDVLPSPA
jgi:hypothetical protein